MHTSLLPLFRSTCFWSVCLAWLIAQTTKMICGLQRTRRVDFQYLVSLGGMPSAHTAAACAMAASVGLEGGFGRPLFVLALFFAAVTMFDAATVRLAAGHQAKLLNELLDELFKSHRLSERKLAELLGHTRLEILMGALIGILTALLVKSAAVLNGPLGR